MRDRDFAFYSLEFTDRQGNKSAYEFPNTKSLAGIDLQTETIEIPQDERFVGLIFNTRKGKNGIIYDVAFKVAVFS